MNPTLVHYAEIFVPQIFGAGVLLGALKVDLRNLRREIREVKEHQKMQSGRIWALSSNPKRGD